MTTKPSHNRLTDDLSLGDCAICFEPKNLNQEPTLLKLKPCEHSYHQACIKPWLQKSMSCPYCREHITHGTQVRSISRDNIPERVIFFSPTTFNRQHPIDNPTPIAFSRNHSPIRNYLEQILGCVTFSALQTISSIYFIETENIAKLIILESIVGALISAHLILAMEKFNFTHIDGMDLDYILNTSATTISPLVGKFALNHSHIPASKSFAVGSLGLFTFYPGLALCFFLSFFGYAGFICLQNKLNNFLTFSNS